MGKFLQRIAVLILPQGLHFVLPTMDLTSTLEICRLHVIVAGVTYAAKIAKYCMGSYG